MAAFDDLVGTLAARQRQLSSRLPAPPLQHTYPIRPRFDLAKAMAEAADATDRLAADVEKTTAPTLEERYAANRARARILVEQARAEAMRLFQAGEMSSTDVILAEARLNGLCARMRL